MHFKRGAVVDVDRATGETGTGTDGWNASAQQWQRDELAKGKGWWDGYIHRMSDKIIRESGDQVWGGKSESIWWTDGEGLESSSEMHWHGGTEEWLEAGTEGQTGYEL